MCAKCKRKFVNRTVKINPNNQTMDSMKVSSPRFIESKRMTTQPENTLLSQPEKVLQTRKAAAISINRISPYNSRPRI